MSLSFSEYAARIVDLHRRLGELEDHSAVLQLEPLHESEWFQLLEQKLLPQLSDDAFLVAAVVGGTNIGKSVLFNHLAGTRASGTSPTASGTKHATCLVPGNFSQAHDLAAIFPGFELQQWSDSERALQESDSDWLFWRECESLPERLLVLDTPDIDSDARVNWARADKVRRSADVLIAVLTQQKYNDAAVKEFFRRAAAEDKFVLVVFNQVHLPDDEPYWPLWLKTFCDETGIKPGFLYLAPHDRRAAEENRLELFERRWPVTGIDPDSTPDQSPNADPHTAAVDPHTAAVDPHTANAALPTAEAGPEPRRHHPGTGTESDAPDDPARLTQGMQAGRRLGEDLAQLRFGEIKLQTLSSSLELVLGEEGVPACLDRVRRRAGEFRSASELLSTHKLAEVENWPMLRNALIVEKIRHWWQEQREGWSAKIHTFYNRIGTGITGGIRFIDEHLRGPQTPPLEAYRAREWEAVLDAVDDVYNRLNWFRELGNPLLQPRLERLLGATTRQELLDRMRVEHEEMDLDSKLRALVTRELETFRDESPDWYRSLRHLDSAAAAARPATSIALFITGFGPVGGAVGQLATETAVTSVVSVAGDVASGGVTAAVGETWISSTASSGLGWLEARFRRIHERFVAERAAWLAERLQLHLLGTLPEELAQAALIPQSEPFREVERLARKLRSELAASQAADAPPADAQPVDAQQADSQQGDLQQADPQPSTSEPADPQQPAPQQAVSREATSEQAGPEQSASLPSPSEQAASQEQD